MRLYNWSIHCDSSTLIGVTDRSLLAVNGASVVVMFTESSGGCCFYHLLKNPPPQKKNIYIYIYI